ncbi:MAG: hypothetical protein CO105_05650 [Comamonadaceae bacterium CG_4_9_14_3_um_filter_60_33]|nr:MAG: hypothetical protein COZ09_00010 [Comamonadaceae bacterium CG_4_10_14_3_um_filter_60_42]PJB44679.1 MAG: hypothetical protein CO105_05650 [Comamonadaceae bacterium CG_4_9_14_3_um_filter_60_33]
MPNLASSSAPAQLAPVPAQRPLHRALLWLVIGFLLVAAGLVAWTLAYLRSQTIESSERLTQSFAQVIEEQTSRTLQTIDQRLQLAANGLAQLETAGTLNEAAAHALLQAQAKELPFVRAIWVLDAQGRIRYDSDLGNIGISLADRPYFQAYLAQPQTRFYLGSPVRSRTTGTWLISAARPLRTADGAFAGIIVAAVEPPYFDKLWRSVDLGADSSIALFRSDGTLMMRSPFDETAMGKVFSGTRLFSELLPTSPAGSYRSNSAIDGTLRSFAYRTLSAQSSLVVVVGQSFERLLAPWRQQAWLAAALVLVMALVTLASVRHLGQAWQRQQQDQLTLQAKQQALQEKTSVLRLFIEHAPAAIAMFDRDMRYLAYSRRWLLDLGLAEQALAGRCHYDIFPNLPDRWKQIHRRCLAGATEKCDEDPFARADGSTDWVHWEVHPWRTGAGDIGGIIIFSEVITERKRAEAALRASHEQLRLVTDHALVLLAHCDQQQRYRFVNQPYADMFALPAADFVGKPLRDVLGDAAYTVAQPYLKAVLAGQPQEYDMALPSAKNGTRYMHAAYAPERDASGRVIGFVAAIVDITERQQAEQQIRAQLDELLRWQELMVGREQRMVELKAEVNELCNRLGEAVRYAGEAGA